MRQPRTRKKSSQHLSKHQYKQQLRRWKQAPGSEEWKHHWRNNTQKRNTDNKKLEQGGDKKINRVIKQRTNLNQQTNNDRKTKMRTAADDPAQNTAKKVEM